MIKKKLVHQLNPVFSRIMNFKNLKTNHFNYLAYFSNFFLKVQTIT